MGQILVLLTNGFLLDISWTDDVGMNLFLFKYLITNEYLKLILFWVGYNIITKDGHNLGKVGGGIVLVHYFCH